jgi:hypothetical protein
VNHKFLQKMEKQDYHDKYVVYYSIYKNRWNVSVEKLEALFGGNINDYADCVSARLSRESIRKFANRDGNWTTEHMEHFLQSLERCFEYDFVQDCERENKKGYYLNLLKVLKEYKPSNNSKKKDKDKDNPNSPELSTVESKILDNLKGIYYGYFYNKKDKVRNFILWIKNNRQVELRGGHNYYKFGTVKLGISSVVLEVHEDENTNPELFITKIDDKLHGRNYNIKEIILAGSWADREGYPAFGTSVLFKYYEETNERESYKIIKREIEQSNSIADLELMELKINEDLSHASCLSKVTQKLANGEIHITTSLTGNLVIYETPKKSKSP